MKVLFLKIRSLDLDKKLNLDKRSSLLKNERPDQLYLPKYVGANNERSNEIMNIITKAKNGGLKTNVDGKRNHTR